MFIYRMTYIEFLFDIEKDLRNIWDTVNNPIKYGHDFSRNIPPSLLNVSRGKTFEESKSELNKINSKFYKSSIIKFFVKVLNDSWSNIEGEYIKRLEKITAKPFAFEKISAFITTIQRCPYNVGENSFMVYCFSNVFDIMRASGHEIFHLHFHKHYWHEVEKELGNQKTHELKEALTVLLNLEFRDLWFAEDKGYEIHKELREFIRAEWNKDKNFDILINKCMKKMKGGSK